MGKAENGVQIAVMGLLTAERIWHRRMNTGAVTVEATETSKRRFIAYGAVGMADILATPLFPFEHSAGTDFFPTQLWIETKAATKQRPSQIEFQKDVEAAGHHYMIAKSSDDVILYLRKHGFERISGRLI